jgi:hypothetical protein
MIPQNIAPSEVAERVVLPRRHFLKGLAALVAAPAVVKAEILMPIKVWRPPLEWREGFLVLNGAELKAGEFPALFEVFGHHFGGQGATFRLPSTVWKVSETLISSDATQRGFFYRLDHDPNIGKYWGRWVKDGWLTMQGDQGGWVWQDFFRRENLPREDRYDMQRKFQSRVVQESNRRAAAWCKAHDAALDAGLDRREAFEAANRAVGARDRSC